jgi:hypothetical protein
MRPLFDQFLPQSSCSTDGSSGFFSTRFFEKNCRPLREFAHLVTELGLVKSRLGECLGRDQPCRRKEWRVLATAHLRKLGRRISMGLQT